jgi:hypothetical protein
LNKKSKKTKLKAKIENLKKVLILGFEIIKDKKIIPKT